jgi:hypothetical protein
MGQSLKNNIGKSLEIETVFKLTQEKNYLFRSKTTFAFFCSVEEINT